SGGTAAFNAPGVPAQTPPSAAYGRPSHDPYGASAQQPPLYRDAPASGTYGAPTQQPPLYRDTPTSATHGAPAQQTGGYGQTGPTG
ncbi:hypothetical protein GT354_08640, partial [Streptomyces sp. SID3343]|nr:hypothetical protein [Streptomyces sp. SID3343]